MKSSRKPRILHKLFEVSLKIMERNMKLFNTLVGLILFFFTFSVWAATINGRINLLSTNSSNCTVLLQINTNTGTDDLGGATIVFDFDTTALNFTNSPVYNVDYIFHNFSGGNYSSATVTRPMANQIWVNIDLPFSNNNNGTVLAQSPGWTDLVTINFDIVDPNGMASLTWITNSPFWGIYDANNSTLWQTGQFQNLFGPLPVELIGFTGTLLQNDNVLLEWKTASSVNNFGFEVLKSYTNFDAWEAIGFVESHGDPNELVDYSFTDITIHRFPVIRYRLKSIDDDGSFQYSQIVEINTAPTNYELSQNYPNPFNPSTMIRYTIPSNLSGQISRVIIKVYDILGNEVETLVNENKEPGMYEIEFNAQSLTSGTYIYRITADSFVEAKKMILIR